MHEHLISKYIFKFEWIQIISRHFTITFHQISIWDYQEYLLHKKNQFQQKYFNLMFICTDKTLDPFIVIIIWNF